MLLRVSIDKISEKSYAECQRLYESAFPSIERRDQSYQQLTLERDRYHFEAIFNEDVWVGIIGYWRLDCCFYIEHLATTPSVRGLGYGATLLAQLCQEERLPIILEVEHPEDTIAQRRIGFYERCGFHLNHYKYSHPSYDPRSSERVSLLIMSHPFPLSKTEFEQFKEECFKEVHFMQKYTSTQMP